MNENETFELLAITRDVDAAERWDPNVYLPDQGLDMIQYPLLTDLRHGKNQPQLEGRPNEWQVKVIPRERSPNRPAESTHMNRLRFCHQFVKEYMCFHDNNNWYVVMEPTPKHKTLDHWLENNRGDRNTAEQLQSILFDVAYALTVLDTVGLACTKIKPAKIGLRTSDQGVLQAYLVDLSFVLEAEMCDETYDREEEFMRLVEECCDKLFDGNQDVLIQYSAQLRKLGEDLKDSQHPSLHISCLMHQLKDPKYQKTTWIAVAELIDRLESEVIRINKSTLVDFKWRFLEVINSPAGQCFATSVINKFEEALSQHIMLNISNYRTPRASIIYGRGGNFNFGLIIQGNPWQIYIGEISDSASDPQPVGWGLFIYLDAIQILGRNRIQAMMGKFTSMDPNGPDDLLLRTLITEGCASHLNCCVSTRDGQLKHLLWSSDPGTPAKSISNNRLQQERPIEDQFTGHVYKNERINGLLEYAPNRDNILSYEGEWAENKHHGLGVLTTIDSVYKGQFHDGSFIRGTHLNLRDGSTITGDFSREDCVRGVWEHPRFRYEGGIQNNLFQGRGQLVNKVTGESFDGYFQQGRFHGKGNLKHLGVTTKASWRDGVIAQDAIVFIRCTQWICQIEPAQIDQDPDYRHGQAFNNRQNIMVDELIEFQGYFFDLIPRDGIFLFLSEPDGRETRFEGQLYLNSLWRNLTVSNLNGIGKLSKGNEILEGNFVDGKLHDVVENNTEFAINYEMGTLAKRTTLGHPGDYFMTETAVGSFIAGELVNGFIFFDNPANKQQQFRYEIPFGHQELPQQAFYLMEGDTTIRAYLNVDKSGGFEEYYHRMQDDLMAVLNEERARFEGRACLRNQEGPGVKYIDERWTLRGNFVEYELCPSDDRSILYDAFCDMSMIGKIEEGTDHKPQLRSGRIIFNFKNEEAFSIGESDLQNLMYVDLEQADYNSEEPCIELFGCKLQIPSNSSQFKQFWQADKLVLNIENGTDQKNKISLLGQGKLYLDLPGKPNPILRFDGGIKDGEIELDSRNSKGRYYFIPELDMCNPEWKYYQGEYKNNKPHGQGKVYYCQEGGSMKATKLLNFENGQVVHFG